MSYKVVFSPAASDDLEDIFIYLAPRNGLKGSARLCRKNQSLLSWFFNISAKGDVA